MISSLHIEPTSRCRLACPRCERTELLAKGRRFLPIGDINIDALDKFIDLKLDDINLCGNLGDPIYHAKFIKLVQMLQTKTEDVCITTNGSGKPAKWWDALNKILRSTDRIKFSIDGLPHNFMQYRINADWTSVKTGIDACVSGPARTTWRFIPFAYNENDIDAAQQLSKELGVDRFVVDLSSRWIENDPLRPSQVHQDSEVKMQYKLENRRDLDIDPVCKNQKQHYISAQGYYSPCCMMTSHVWYYKSEWWKNRQQHDITTSTLSEQCRHFDAFYATIHNQRYDYCVYNCGKCE